MNKQITLTEYSFIFVGDRDEGKNRAIKQTNFDELERFILKNSDTAQYLKPTYKKGFGKVLQAQNYVGIIQTKDGTTIEILPKIAIVDEDEKEKSKEILIKMLKTLKNSPFKHFNTANLKSANLPLLEIFITMFLDELSKLIKRGIRSDYISKEENLKFLKGKLKINEQIKQNYIHKERFFVEYEEYLSNRVENRIIKTTLNYLYKITKLNKNQQRIREYLFVFDEIDPSFDPKNDLSKIKPNRQMKDYELVLLWCKTFLLKSSFTPYKGDDVAFALLFDMNMLFESYVYDYLKKSKEYKSIKFQDKKHYLAYLKDSGRFRLQPDIIININGRKIIADTKWKIINCDKKISQSDMYQLFAYGTKYKNCKKLYLIYPFYDNIEFGMLYNFYKKDDDSNLELEILFFDLSKNCLKTKSHTCTCC